jgi:hypothetical protein
MPEAQAIEEVWRALPGAQSFAIDSRAHHTLFTGTRGPGKTDTQIMFFRKHVGRGYGPFWRGVIFDKEYKNLDDLIGKSKRWFYRFEDGAQWLSSKSDYKWVWPSGEELLFRHFKDEDDYWAYHGQEFPFIGWNELCKYATQRCYKRMMSCNRSSFTEKDWPIDGKTRKPVPLPPIPLVTFSTTNSYGPGHNWVKSQFIDPAPYGVLIRTKTLVYDPKIKAEREVERTQVTIFGSYKENPYLAAEYIAELHSNDNENERKAWLEGDWDIVAGGALDDVWKKAVHILPRFRIPASWHVDRAFDWGSSHPFAVGWFAEANGEEATLLDGSKFCPPAGTLVQIAEIYGTKKLGTNEGVKWPAGNVADAIIATERELLAGQWITVLPSPGPADNQIRDVRETDVDTIEKKMSDKGIMWEESDKSPGSRKIGLQLMRDRLTAATRKEGEALYFMENCRASIATLPTLPRDELKIDDVDTDAEDHPYDMTRYRVLKGANRYARSVQFGFAR